MEDNKKTLVAYMIVLLIIIVMGGIAPASRIVWILQSTGILIVGILIIIYNEKLNLSRISLMLIFIYLMLGAIGSHYSYEKVPIENLKDILGTQKDPHDRIVHFSFGLLLFYPILDFYKKQTKLKNNFWLYFVPLIIITGIGACYEIVEWSIGMIIDPENTYAFLGMMGDQWDAQKDMALNTMGAAFAMLMTMVSRAYKTGKIDL